MLRRFIIFRPKKLRWKFSPLSADVDAELPLQRLQYKPFNRLVQLQWNHKNFEQNYKSRVLRGVLCLMCQSQSSSTVATVATFPEQINWLFVLLLRIAILYRRARQFIQLSCFLFQLAKKLSHYIIVMYRNLQNRLDKGFITIGAF